MHRKIMPLASPDVNNQTYETCPKNTRKISVEDANFFLRKRYLICFLAFIGTVLLYLLRVNLSIAIVEMTSEKQIKNKNETYVKKPDFDWDSKTKGFVLSVFSIGYLFGPYGGVLGLKYGSATIYGFGLVVTALLTVLSPVFLRLNFFLFIFARILEGVFESFAIACLPQLFVHWTPPNERSRLLLLAVAGAHLGTALNYPLSGFLAFQYGWEAVFYVTGSIVFVWYTIWLICAANDPITDKWIAEKERDYFKSISSTNTEKVIHNTSFYMMENGATLKVSYSMIRYIDYTKVLATVEVSSLGKIPKQKQKFGKSSQQAGGASFEEEIIIPWRKLLTSIPFWVYMNEYFSYAWSVSFLMYCLPLYIHDIFVVNVQDNGLICAIPVTVGFVGLIVAAFSSDYLRNRGTFTKPFLHRVFIATGHVSFVMLMIYTALKADFVESIICLSLTRFFHGLSEVSYNVIIIDMFYKYTGVVRGISLIGGSVALFSNPIVMGIIVSDHTRSSWNIYFLLLCIFNIWSLIIYYFFGSGELQEWAVPKTSENTDND